MRYIPVGRIDGSIDGKNRWVNRGKNRWVNRGKNRWVNRGKNRCHCYTLLQVQQREEDETEDSERRKKKETSKNSSNLMLRIEMAIKDSRVFCSSALLCDWEWNGFGNFLKLIRSSSHFCCSAMHSSLCSCRFGHEDIKKNKPGSQPGLAGPTGSRVPGRPSGSTEFDRANSQPIFCLDPARPQTRVDPPGQAGS